MESIFDLYRTFTEKQESPDIFHAWACIATIISALGRNVCIDFRTYKVFPNEYIVLIAGSAKCRKSQALTLGTDVLFDLEDPPAISSQKITHESLIEFLGTNNGVGTVSSSELAVFLGPDALGTGLLGTLCDLYDYSKRPWSYMTKARGVETIGTPLLNLFAASTPEWLGWILPRAAVAAGFTSRVLFVMGKDRRFREAMPYMGPRQMEARTRLIDRLNQVRKLNGTFAFTPEAERFYRDWYENQDNISAPGMDGYAGRKQTHVLKLGMAIAAAEGLELSLDAPHLEMAVGLLDNLEAQLPDVYAEINSSQFGKETQIVLAHIRRTGTMTHRDLQKAVWRQLKATELSETIDTLLAANLIDCSLDGPRSKRTYTALDPADDV